MNPFQSDQQIAGRQATGKTPVMTVMKRQWLFGSVPGVLIVLFLMAMGGWVLIPGVLIGWFLVVLLQPVAIRGVVNKYTDTVAHNNPGYREWRAGGGDPYTDAQGFPFNADSAHTSVSIPSEVPLATPQTKRIVRTRACNRGHFNAPPDRLCPRCRCDWNPEYGQCDWCFTYWDSAEQGYVYFDPDPRGYTPKPVKRRDNPPDDPSTMHPRNLP